MPEVFKPARLVRPKTLSDDDKLAPDVTLSDPPTETLPDVVKDESVVEPALRVPRFVKPDTVRELKSEFPATLIPDKKSAPEVTERDCPIPTLPETLRDEPIPTNPVNLPVPATSRLYEVTDVPIPSLLLEESK